MSDPLDAILTLKEAHKASSKATESLSSALGATTRPDLVTRLASARSGLRQALALLDNLLINAPAHVREA